MTEPKVEIFHQKDHPTDETFPPVSEALVNRLEEIFPDRCPQLTAKDREIWYRCGQVDIVRYLRRIHEEQHKRRQ